MKPVLDGLAQKMTGAETEPEEGKGKWNFAFCIHCYPESPSVFDLFYKQKALSRGLCEYYVKDGCEGNLITERTGPGYENLCFLWCIQTWDTSFGWAIFARSPKQAGSGLDHWVHVLWLLELLCLRPSGPDPTPPWTLGCSGFYLSHHPSPGTALPAEWCPCGKLLCSSAVTCKE